VSTPYAVRPTSRLARAGRSALAGVGVVLLAGACASSTLNSTDGQSSPASAGSSTGAAPMATATGSATGLASMPVGPFGTSADLAVLGGITVSAPSGTGKTPTVSFASKPVTVSATTRTVLTPGSGDVSVVGSRVTAVTALFKGSDGTLLDSDFDGDTSTTLDLDPAQTIAGLVRGLSGVQVGSRILLVVPPAESFGSAGRPEMGISGTEQLVLVADITKIQVAPPAPLTQAQGTAVDPVAGLPTVTSFDPAGGPTISVPSGTAAPTTTVSQLLVQGAGAPVAAGQKLTVHYTGVLWKDGSVFDSSWTRQRSFSFILGAGNVIKGWDSGLVGKPVGSRVLLVIPPADGYGTAGSPPKISGTDTLVFVVDILAAD
jgi:peptidylprolyl isomerase